MMYGLGCTLNRYSLLPTLQGTYLDIRTEEPKWKEDKVSIKTQFQWKPMKYSTNQLAAQSTKSFVDELMWKWYYQQALLQDIFIGCCQFFFILPIDKW